MQNDLPGALAGYQAAREITARLVELDPHNAQRHKQLADIHLELAGVLRKLGERDAPREHAARAKEISALIEVDSKRD